MVMRAVLAGLLGVGMAASLTACKPGDVGYVEIKTVPAVTSASQPALYLNAVRLQPLRKGVAVLSQRVGTATLATEAGGGQLAPLCDVVVKKNRVTTVTISILERPPRCQCRNGGGKRGGACVS